MLQMECYAPQKDGKFSISKIPYDNIVQIVHIFS